MQPARIWSVLTLPVGWAHTPLWAARDTTGGPCTYPGPLDLQPIPPQFPLLTFHRFHSHTRQVLPQGFLSLSIPKSELITMSREPSTAPQSIPPSPPAAPDPPPDRSFLSQRSTWWGTKDNENVSVWKHEVRGGRTRGHVQRGWLRLEWHPCEEGLQVQAPARGNHTGPRRREVWQTKEGFCVLSAGNLQGV